MLRKLASLLLLVLVAGTVACRPRIVVRLTTTAYHDGSLDRRLEIVGRTSDDEEPTEDDWLGEQAGIWLAEPEAWERVERGPGWLRAEGFFPSADQLPAILALETEAATKPARTRTLLDVDDRVLLVRWTYVERHGDPYSAAESAAALEALVEMAVEAVTSELHRHFGEGVDPAPAERWLRNDARALTQALLTVSRSTPAWTQEQDRIQRQAQVLGQYGVPVVAVDDPEEFWDLQVQVLLGWAQEQLAIALSAPGAPIRPDDLSFWPAGEDYLERMDALVNRVWGSEEELTAEVEPLLAAMVGYYGEGGIPRFRFEASVRLPGTLLKTNGTVDGDSVVWLFREEDLTLGEISLRAESVELNDDALVSLGARRELDTAALLRLADLLWKRDPQGVLVEVLTDAVAAGDPDLLLDEDRLPETFLPVAYELHQLLDPDVPLD
jgi:hypothetical protein